MDPPPPSLFPTTTTTANHPDSANSSPRSRHDTTWDDLPASNLRLMCSYGGHIIPRPHDKSLSYIGGDTRIVVVDRRSSLADLHSRLSHTLLNGRRFTLKYQLPSEELDSLISLSADEDLENMIEEYDRTTAAASPLKPARLRLFLFPSKPEAAASMGSLLDDAKSESWFVDALNGSGLLPRGLSESAAAAIETFLELPSSDSPAAHNDPSFSESGQINPAKSNAQQELVVETSSSFGSSSSSPAMANLPPIKVRCEEHVMVGLDEQFSSHMNLAPPLPFVNIPATAATAAAVKSSGDDEKSAASSGLRKPPLPLQPVQRKLVDIHNLPSPDSKHAAAYNLPSPDSVASDCSIASGGSLAKHTVYQEASRENKAPTSAKDPKRMMNNHINEDPTPTSQIQMQHVAVDSAPQWSQQQFIPSTTHYIHHQHAPMPVSSYYHPMYLHHQSQQQQADQHYPMYLMSPSQPSYDASGRPLTPPLPPSYPTNSETAPPNMHQMGGSAAAPMMVQVPAHQFQQHFIGVPQMQAAPNPNASAAAAAGGGGNYGYEYSHHLQDQAYYAQQVAASSGPPPPQYQTMTPAAAVMFSQASSQITPDSNPQHS